VRTPSRGRTGWALGLASFKEYAERTRGIDGRANEITPPVLGDVEP
jgi:hypothetical protein